MNKSENLKESNVNILECTLRDGSYAIDFKFTLRDTAELVRVLSQTGFRYIEVGHGVGLGAMRVGKGNAPWNDDEVIREAKSSVSNKSLIGVFCIPNIADFDDMRKAKDAGLDFIRIGQEPLYIDSILSYLEEALKLNLIPMVNFMKSYTLSAENLAEKVKIVAEAGAKVIYIVDSAGGMLPDEVSRYFDKLRQVIPQGVKIGFHGHNNLYLAVANCLEAIKHGATYIDTTLYGIGRSAGNAPTEIITAIMSKLGLDIGGIDFLKVMDIVEDYIQPMASRRQMYDMLSVASGYALFHSSFMPQALKIARKHSIDIKQLIAVSGKSRGINCDENMLEKLAVDFPQNKKYERKYFSFINSQSPGMNRHKINNTLETIESFIAELEVVASKTCGEAVLDIVFLSSQQEDLVLSEFVLHDDRVVIGRFYCGNKEIVNNVLEKAKGRIKRIIVDVDALARINLEDIYKILEEMWEEDINFYSFENILINYIINVVLNITKMQKKCIFIYGKKNRIVNNIYNKLKECFAEVCFFDRILERKGDVILTFSAVALEDIDSMLELVQSGGFIVEVSKILNREVKDRAEKKGIGFVSVNPFDAYKGLSTQLFM